MIQGMFTMMFRLPPNGWSQSGNEGDKNVPINQSDSFYHYIDSVYTAYSSLHRLNYSIQPENTLIFINSSGCAPLFHSS